MLYFMSFVNLLTKFQQSNRRSLGILALRHQQYNLDYKLIACDKRPQLTNNSAWKYDTKLCHILKIWSNTRFERKLTVFLLEKSQEVIYSAISIDNYEVGRMIKDSYAELGLLTYGQVYGPTVQSKRISDCVKIVNVSPHLMLFKTIGADL